MGALPLPKELEVRRGHSLHSLCKHILGMCVGECLLKAWEEAAGTGPGAGAATVPGRTAGSAPRAPSCSRPIGLQPRWGIGCGGVAPPRAPLASEEAELLERRREGWASGLLAGRTWPGRGRVCWFPAPGCRTGSSGRREALVETAPLIFTPGWGGESSPSDVVACSGLGEELIVRLAAGSGPQRLNSCRWGEHFVQYCGAFYVKRRLCHLPPFRSSLKTF